MTRKSTLAASAREQAGLTLEQAAQIARLHPRRLRSYELHGGATDCVARRLCHFYKAGADVFHALLFGSTEKPSQVKRVITSSLESRAVGSVLGVAAPKPTQKSRRYTPPRTPVLVTVDNVRSPIGARDSIPQEESQY